MMGSPKIVVAGASGYIGQALLSRLLIRFPDAQITALSRSDQASNDPRIVWKSCDLFSLKALESAIPVDVDLACYLVHSMGPTAYFDQGSFADYDLLLADNFTRILKSTSVTQLIYLGGLIPESTAKLSLHLQSRLEVEETFAQARIPLTIFRAGLIIGDAGSSFQILTKLVRRLPVMICPRWTQHLTTPVDLDTVVDALATAALEFKHVGRVYDLAGCHSLTYVDMMRQTAKKMGRSRAFLTVPFFTPFLSRLWVSLITGTSKGLVYPLIASLEHEMVARPDHLFENHRIDRPYVSLLDHVTFKRAPAKRVARYQVQRKTVRSVQRLMLPEGKNAEWVKNEYLAWLPRSQAPLVKVVVEGLVVSFCAFIHKAVLLELTLNTERSSPDRQLLYITGGLLTADDNKGRLEFRVVLNRQFVIAAIHDYKPSLPSFIYRNTQARVHLLVMKAFGAFLKKKSLRPISSEQAATLTV